MHPRTLVYIFIFPVGLALGLALLPVAAIELLERQDVVVLQCRECPPDFDDVSWKDKDGMKLLDDTGRHVPNATYWRPPTKGE